MAKKLRKESGSLKPFLEDCMDGWVGMGSIIDFLNDFVKLFLSKGIKRGFFRQVLSCQPVGMPAKPPFP
jgi:hypothetical protein